MSLKPTKHSDRNKAWMQPRRDTPKKIHPEYHLIFTEGETTEPAYFKSIQYIINQQFSDRIHLDIHGEGNNTLNLLNAAKKRANEIPGKYRHIWLVFDTDDFPAEHIDQTVIECAEISTEETEYHAVWSNQCIELWFLLHFSYMHSDIHRTEYYPKLTNQLKSIGQGKYSKTRDDMYEILRPYMDTAISFAKKLEKENIGKSPSQSAPGTKVYELIEKLKPYL